MQKHVKEGRLLLKNSKKQELYLRIFSKMDVFVRKYRNFRLSESFSSKKFQKNIFFCFKTFLTGRQSVNTSVIFFFEIFNFQIFFMTYFGDHIQHFVPTLMKQNFWQRIHPEFLRILIDAPCLGPNLTK